MAVVGPVPVPTEPRRARRRLATTLALTALLFGAAACSNGDDGVRAAGPEQLPSTTDTTEADAGTDTTRPPRTTTSTTATFDPGGSGSGTIPMPSTGGDDGPGADAVAAWSSPDDAYQALANGACSVLSSVSFWSDDAVGWAAARRVVDVFASLTPPPSATTAHRELVDAFRASIDASEASGDTFGEDTDPTNGTNEGAKAAGLTMCVAGDPESGRGYGVPGSLLSEEDTLDTAAVEAMLDWELALRDPYELLGGARSCVRNKALAEPDTVRDNLFLSGLTEDLGRWAGECGVTVDAGYNHLEPQDR